jgi:transposase-like protein
MKNIYKRHRFPPSIIQYAVWLYYRFNMSIRDVEDLLAERNISVSYEAIRLWINKLLDRKLGPEFAQRLRGRHSGFGDTYFLDEFFVKIGGIQHYLWRPVDQDGVAHRAVHRHTKTFRKNRISRVIHTKATSTAPTYPPIGRQQPSASNAQARAKRNHLSWISEPV